MLPPIQMQQLFDAVKEAGSTSAVWTEFPTGNHMEAFDICRAQYWPAVQAFVKQLFADASGAARVESAMAIYALQHTALSDSGGCTGEEAAAAVKERASEADVSASSSVPT